ncbi:MAG: hypothetical protein KDB61_09110, partial [Planctomycetes bacterium]|nr:hypothetical protein [Planctomycetota bacterium]
MPVPTWIEWMGALVLVGPLLAFLGMVVVAVFELPLSERVTNRWVQWTSVVAIVACTSLGIWMLVQGRAQLPVEFGDLVSLPELHFHFRAHFLFDRLSLPFLMLSFVLCSVVGAFARVYLHREEGYRRFYLLFALFELGMVLSSAAGTVELMFAGWEMVGLSSALLIAFFQDRPASVHNGLRVWSVYRIADAAFLMAAVVLHHLVAGGDFTLMTGVEAWPNGSVQVEASAVWLAGGLLLVSAAGKSGLWPFSGWLPRAMEGPTPSSAIFYGALSIHLGTFLLLRFAPLLEQSLALRAILILLGLGTAVWASLVAKVQADIKSSLAFASLTQVGIIVAEIGAGWESLALIHILGNASLRTLQLLRAPSLLHDVHQLECATGEDWVSGQRMGSPSRWRQALYRAGFQRDAFDLVLQSWIVDPFLKLCHGYGRAETSVRRWLSGAPQESTTPPTVLLPTWVSRGWGVGLSLALLGLVLALVAGRADFGWF